MLLFGIIILAVVGLAMLFGAWHLTRETRQFKRTALNAPGVITAFSEKRSQERTTDDATTTTTHETVAYFPTITFTNRDGRPVTFTSDTAVDQYAFPVGEPVKVLYDPAQPERARVDSFASLQGGPVVLTVMGLMFSGAAVLAFFLIFLNKTPDTGIFVGGAFALMSCLLLLGTWYLGRDSFYLHSHGSKTTGQVVSVDSGTLIEFTTQAGVTRKFLSQVSSNPPKYAPGDKVPIIYDPAKPARARINSFDDLWLFPCVIGGLAAACLIAAAFAFLIKTRNP